MPRDKDLKRIVRARMKKTGEAYTTARAHTVDKSATDASPPDPDASPLGPDAPLADPTALDLAALAGMSDEKVHAKTGRGWADWTDILDQAGAVELEHGAIARIVRDRFGVADWWAQTVTVGYERIKGLREPGQRRGGTYEISKSRTFSVPVERLFDACADDATRGRWMTDSKAVVSTATKPRTLRLRWSDGTLVALYFTAKGATRSAVTVQHSKLPDRATADRLKAYWGERLTGLDTLLK